VSEADLGYDAGTFTVVGTERGVSIFDLAGDHPLRSDVEFAGPQAFPFGAYVVAVEVDRQTGRVKIVRFAAVDDVGVVVNPRLVEGQVIGSIAQGIGQALYEEVMYDDEGQPLTTTFMDYSLPTSAEIPEVTALSTVTPNPNNPLGVKGAGESGCIGTPPAVINAIHDALGLGEHVVDMPAIPERVWRAMQRAGL
jgi:carbon-monoxide dehydrogenase large subunit